jgi:murein DD-endopeptidase MepM/ murein hydrolase activator NlpD
MMVALPLEEIRINSQFGMRRDPMNRRKSRMHNGLDLKAKYEDVYSMFPGTVTAASYSTSGGYYVTVDYGVCVCSFLHLSKIEVKNGQHVSAGQKIAVSGNTGKRTTGPHLHLSCKWSDTGKFFDPRILLRFITNELLKYSKLR